LEFWRTVPLVGALQKLPNTYTNCTCTKSTTLPLVGNVRL
jgi:hypothetical protein